MPATEEPIILHLPIKRKAADPVVRGPLTAEKVGRSMEASLFRYNPDISDPVPYSGEGGLDYARIADPKDIGLNTNFKSGQNDHVQDMFSGMLNPKYPEYWPSRTDVSCWWCCHKFDTQPIPLPTKFVDGKYAVTGCFCSPNCALAYNYNKKDNQVAEREVLLKRMVGEMFQNQACWDVLTPAPPKEVLAKFGGVVDIAEYRRNLLVPEKSYQIAMPPVMVMIPKVEILHTKQKNMIKQSKKLRNSKSFIPLDMDRVEQAIKNLNKKKANRAKNCLEITMGLTMES